jgi:hypothetical protein
MATGQAATVAAVPSTTTTTATIRMAARLAAAGCKLFARAKTGRHHQSPAEGRSRSLERAGRRRRRPGARVARRNPQRRPREVASRRASSNTVSLFSKLMCGGSYAYVQSSTPTNIVHSVHRKATAAQGRCPTTRGTSRWPTLVAGRTYCKPSSIQQGRARC